MSSGLALKLLGPCWIRGLASPQDVLKNPQGFRTFDSQDQPQHGTVAICAPWHPSWAVLVTPGYWEQG